MNTDKLNNISKDIRKYIFNVVKLRGGHLSTAYSATEILVSLYFTNLLNINNKNFKDINRNYFLLSKGHGETLLYAILVKKKIIPKIHYEKHYRAGRNILGGHVDISTPGIEITSGALGHGLGIGCGIALGQKIKKSKKKVFVLLGDAECSEGAIWEAALFAKKYKLNNLIGIVDNNKIGATNFTSKFTSVEPIDKKFKSFGWNVKVCNGHSIKEIYKNLSLFKKKNKKQPNILICNTIKGKGIKFLENDPKWHSKALNNDQKILGLKELLKNEN